MNPLLFSGESYAALVGELDDGKHEDTPSNESSDSQDTDDDDDNKHQLGSATWRVAKHFGVFNVTCSVEEKRDKWRKDRKEEAKKDIFKRDILPVAIATLASLTNADYESAPAIDQSLSTNPGFPCADLLQLLLYQEGIEKKKFTRESYQSFMKCLLESGCLKDDFRQRLIDHHATSLNGLKNQGKRHPKFPFEKVGIEVTKKSTKKKHQKIGGLFFTLCLVLFSCLCLGGGVLAGVKTTKLIEVAYLSPLTMMMAKAGVKSARAKFTDSGLPDSYANKSKNILFKETFYRQHAEMICASKFTRLQDASMMFVGDFFKLNEPTMEWQDLVFRVEDFGFVKPTLAEVTTAMDDNQGFKDLLYVKKIARVSVFVGEDWLARHAKFNWVQLKTPNELLRMPSLEENSALGLLLCCFFFFVFFFWVDFFFLCTVNCMLVQV